MTDPQAPAETSDFDLLDREDEQQILDDLRGIPVDKFVYKNARGVFELSYAGTKWAVRKMAEHGEALRVTGHPRVELCPMDPEYILVTVLAERVKVDKESSREIRLDSNVGSSRRWKKQTLTSGKVIPDDHFFKKAVSIATRNVQQALMSAEFKIKMISELASGKASKPPDKKAAPAAKAPTKPATPSGSGDPTSAPPQKGADKPPLDQQTRDRQKLYIVMGRHIKDSKERKKCFIDLTGKESSKDIDATTLSRLTAAFERMGDGKVNELKKYEDGKYFIYEKPTKNTLFPAQPKQEEPAKDAEKAPEGAPASAAPEEELF